MPPQLFPNVVLNAHEKLVIEAAFAYVASNEELLSMAERVRLDIFGILREKEDGSRVFTLDGSDDNGLCPLIAKFDRIYEKKVQNGAQLIRHKRNSILLRSIKAMHGESSGVTSYAIQAFRNAVDIVGGECPIVDGVDLELLEYERRAKQQRTEREKKRGVAEDEEANPKKRGVAQEEEVCPVSPDPIVLSSDEEDAAEDGKRLDTAIYLSSDEESSTSDEGDSPQEDDDNEKVLVLSQVEIRKDDLFEHSKIFCFTAEIAVQHSYYGPPEEIYARGEPIDPKQNLDSYQLVPRLRHDEICLGGTTYLLCDQCHGHKKLVKDGSVRCFEQKFFEQMRGPYFFPQSFGFSFLKLLHHKHHDGRLFPVLTLPPWMGEIPSRQLPTGVETIVGILCYSKHYIAFAVNTPSKQVVTVDGLGTVKSAYPKTFRTFKEWEFTAQITTIMKQYGLLDTGVADGTFDNYSHVKTMRYIQDDGHSCMPIACSVVAEWFVA